MSFSTSVTWHAADRYVERVKPALTRAEARAELERLVPVCPIVDRPDWARPSDDPLTLYLEPADGIVFVLEPDESGRQRFVLVTVLIRGRNGERRRARSEDRQKVWASHRLQRRKGRGRRADEWAA